MTKLIYLHAQAPEKPALAAPCNGCGVCCASEPCPLGMVISRKRQGACKALHWQADASRYRCGLIVKPQQHLPPGLRWLAPLLRRLAMRSISAGSGCDAAIEVEKDA